MASPTTRRHPRPLAPLETNAVDPALTSLISPVRAAAKAAAAGRTAARPTAALLPHAAEVSALRAAIRGGALGVAVHTLVLSGGGDAASLAVGAARRALAQARAPADPACDQDILPSSHALAVLLALGGDLSTAAPDAAWPDPPPPSSPEAAAGRAAAAALAEALYPGLIPPCAADPAAPLLDAAYSHAPARAAAAARAVEALLLAALPAAGPAGAFSALAFARSAGYGRLAVAARAAAANDIAGGVRCDSAGLASLTAADLTSVLLPAGRPASSARDAFDAVSAWYEGDPPGRAPAVAGLLEGCVRLRRLRPHELEEISEAPATNATPAATAAFARAYLDVAYMGLAEWGGDGEEEEGEGEEQGEGGVAGPAPAITTALLAGAALTRPGGALEGGGLTPPRRRRRLEAGGAAPPGQQVQQQQGAGRAGALGRALF